MPHLCREGEILSVLRAPLMTMMRAVCTGVCTVFGVEITVESLPQYAVGGWGDLACKGSKCFTDNVFVGE